MSDTYTTAEIAAAVLYRARREKQLWPHGERRQAGWFPRGSEVQACCANVKYPKGLNANVKLHHCCTAGHVAAMCNADVKNVRRLARLLDDAHTMIDASQRKLVLELRKSTSEARYTAEAALELVRLWHEGTNWTTIAQLDDQLRQLACQLIGGGMQNKDALEAVGALGG